MDGVTLGRAATKIASVLIGKEKVDRVPNLDCGDYVIVINASKLAVTGKKMDAKMYYRHSGYPGALKEFNLRKMMVSHPDRVVTLAVTNMLPNTRLRDKMLARLMVFAGAEHPHAAQKPVELKI